MKVAIILLVSVFFAVSIISSSCRAEHDQYSGERAINPTAGIIDWEEEVPAQDAIEYVETGGNCTEVVRGWLEGDFVGNN